jgi:hypothetical protein
MAGLRILAAMHNDPELSGKYLGTISADFVKVADILKEASYQVRSRKISDYPIFPICKTHQSVGQWLVRKEKLDLTWNYYISFLDEFLQRELILKEKEGDFAASYKDPDEFCCLFVVDEEFTRFVFIPYPED